MGRKSKKKKLEWRSGLKDETKHSILAVISFVLALFFTMASFGKAGIVGASIYSALTFLFGTGFFLLPFAFLLASISFLTSFRPNFMMTTLVGGIFFLASSLGITDLLFQNNGAGGWVGKVVSYPLIKLFDFWTSLVFLFAILIISVLVMFNLKISLKWPKWLKFSRKKEEEYEEYVDEEEYKKDEEEYKKDEEDETSDISADAEVLADKEEESTPGVDSIVTSIKEKIKPKFNLSVGHLSGKMSGPFTPPPLSLLETDKGKPAVGDTKANANIIKRTLQNFGIEVEMGEISIGPSVTQYTLKPAEGIKISKIIGLQNDLSLALAAHPLRIEAPIPGKSLVGIEIPNSVKSIVGLATILSEEEFQKSPKSLLFSLGKGVSGKVYFGDLAKMPHLLIAGSTGAGKSVMIHSLIISLLYRNSPEYLRFIMIDPKRVELTLYNGIANLLTPVVTDPKKAILTLKWAAREMERRYSILEENSVRDIVSYHKNILAKAKLDKPAESPEGIQAGENRPETMPHIIIVIDELADIMASYPRELESAVVRLAQMSRAVGIHLVVSTQRPSVEVITGLIKANIPSRIALQVASQVDSRTILDMAGAEKLLGSGDMLYLAGDMAKPRRIQSPFISENEVKKVVKFLKKQYEFADQQTDEINLFVGEGRQNSIFSAQGGPAPGWEQFDSEASRENEDELYEEARKLVIEAGKASASYLQRRLKVGYARAARLLDMLEERGIIGPGEGAKPREVYSKQTDPVATADIEKDDEEENEMS